MGMTAGIICGLIAMFGYGISTAFSQVPIKRIGSKKTVFFRSIITSVLLLFTIPFFLSNTVFSLKYILIAFGIALIGGYLPLLAFYKALKVGKVGIISPIAGSYIVFTVLFSTIFFNEKLSSFQMLSIGVILTGIILISVNFKAFKKSHLFSKSSGVFLALITSLFWGLLFFLLKIPVMMLGPILTSLIVEIGIVIYSGINIKIAKLKIGMPNRNTWGYLFLVGFFAITAGVSYNFGITFADVSIVAALASANPIVTTLYGKFVYKDKLKMQQWIAIFFIIFGLIMLSLL